MRPPPKVKDLLLQRIMRRYIVGYSLQDALRAARRVVRAGWQVTVCPWNFPDDSPEKVAQNYVAAVQGIAAVTSGGYVSVKARALAYSLDLLREVIAAAKPHNMRIHFDSLEPETAEATFRLIEQALAEYPNLGCTLPARWRRSARDVHRVLEWQIPVRVVKGQWKDPEAPESDLDAAFLSLLGKLAGRSVHVAVATHNVSLARRAFSLLRETGTPSRLEVLYGLPLRVAHVAGELNMGVTMYIPYGRACLPYDIYVLRKNPVILKWMLRDLLMGDHFQLP